MKTLIVSLFALTLNATNVFAADLYLVEPMVCRGEIIGNPREMHPSYAQLLMVVTSFKSTRRDGSLADSLEIRNDYAARGEKMDPETANFGEVWQRSPMYVKGDSVFHPSVSGRDDQLKLKIRSKVINRNGTETHTLTGYLSTEGDVAGRKGYQLECKAVVVENVKRVDDNTRR